MDSEDYYVILGLEDINCSKEQISKSFKKMCLVWHPDKNKEPCAPEKFHKLHKAYEILSDDKAREAYDNVIRAKIARKKRDSEMDSKRRKMKEDLENRESKFKKQKQEEVVAKEKLKQEIERLRRDGFETLNKIMKKSVEEKKEARNKQECESINPTLRVSWNKKKGEYTKDRLQYIFKLFGEIEYIVISNTEKKKKGIALVSFKYTTSALLAINQTLGDTTNPLTLSFIGPIPNAQPNSAIFTSTSEILKVSNTSISLADHEDFESKIMEKMKAAAERQKSQTLNS